MHSNKLVLFFVLFSLVFTISLQEGYSLLTADSECKEGRVLVFRENVQKYACVFDSTAIIWETREISEVVEPMDDAMDDTIEDSMEDSVDGMEDAMDDEITSFEDCVEAGNPVMESYPRQCRTADGQNFVEEIQMPQTSGVFPEIMMYTQTAPDIDEEKGYFVTEIADGIYWLLGSGYQTMFLTTGEGVIVIDAPQPIGEKYLQAIQNVTSEPITHMIYSHSHADHTGAAAEIFPANIQYIAHEDAADLLISENRGALPTVTFNDTHTLSVGNQTLELSYIGAFHSPGDLVILAPEQKVAMVVDLFRPAESPYRAFGVTPDLDVHLQAHDTLVNDYDFEVLISGHTQILATKDHITTNKEFVLSVMDIVTQALDDVPSDEVVQTCVDNTIKQWNGTLGNLEEFMADHCTAMKDYVISQQLLDPTKLFVAVPHGDNSTDSDDVLVNVPDAEVKQRVVSQLDLLALKLSLMQEIAKNQDVIDYVIASNKRFDAMDDANKYIADKDAEWLKTPKNTITPFMASVMENSISDLLREKSTVDTADFGMVVFPEIFITNSYGANVAQSIRTEDYNQSDESWWLQGNKELVHIRDIAWDESAGIFSTDIIVKLVDDKGNFIGVLNAATPIR